WISKNDGIDGTGISLFLHPVYFIQFSMLQMKERAKFMPENKVFGQAGGENRSSPLFFYKFRCFLSY
ncbi:MAG: hypothetical protein SO471_05020, partial [Anaerobutyricum hallii]|uniref:hypothetical protein n=1 Tax=Anaerobutyricum hallii TaxID=39488 RepID=UPI002A80C4A7